jgi:hypothetical protein
MISLIKAIVRIIVILMFIDILPVCMNNFFSIWNHRYSDSYQSYYWTDLSIVISIFLISIFILFVVWLKAGSVGRLLVGKTGDNNKLVIDTSNLELFRMVLIFIGVYLLVTNISELSGLIGYHFRLMNSTSVYDITPEDQAKEMKLWIVPIVSIIIGLGLTFGLKKRWWRWESGRRKNTNASCMSKPFSVKNITVAGFDPEKSYQVIAVKIEQYTGKGPEFEEIVIEGSESDNIQEIAYFLVGDDNGKFVWIAEDECRLAPFGVEIELKKGV